MWIKKYSNLYNNITTESIWNAWIDVNHWSTWHSDLEYCKMNNPFVVGSHFMLKPKGAPAVKIKLIEINEGLSFTDCTSFIGAKMYDRHELEETPEGLRITNTIWVTGILSWLWIKLVANKVAESHPDEINALVNLVSKQHG